MSVELLIVLGLVGAFVYFRGKQKAPGNGAGTPTTITGPVTPTPAGPTPGPATNNQVPPTTTEVNPVDALEPNTTVDVHGIETQVAPQYTVQNGAVAPVTQPQWLSIAPGFTIPEGTYRQGNIRQDPATGWWFYESWTEIDPQKFERYKQVFRQIDPSTGRRYTWEGLAKLLDTSVQNVFDMDKLMKVEIRNAQL